jgi:hypothetical protein
MILTTHALIGAAVGKYVSNPFLQILLLIPMHYILDAFRHGEYLDKKSTFRNTTWKVVLDFLVGVAIILFVGYSQNMNQAIFISMITGALISMFPDLLTVLYWKLNFKFLEKAYRLNKFTHSRFSDESPERQWNFRNARNDIFFSIIAILLLVL